MLHYVIQSTALTGSLKTACLEAIHVILEEYENKNEGRFCYITDESDVAVWNQLRQFAV